MQRTIMAIMLFVGLSTVMVFDEWRTNRHEEQQLRELSELAVMCRERVESGTFAVLGAVDALGALFVLCPDPSQEEFDRFAGHVLKNNPPLRSLQYADAVAVYAYPRKGDEIPVEKADRLPSDEKSGVFRENAIETGRATVQGPFEFRLGVPAIAVRSPVSNGEGFLGIATGIVDLPALVGETFYGDLPPEIVYRIVDENGEAVLGRENAAVQFVETTVEFADRKWMIALGRRGQPSFLDSGRLFLWVAGLAVVFAVLSAVRLSWASREKLAAAVEERTRELEEKNEALAREIAERKATEKRLGHSETLLNASQRQARIGGWEYDAETRTAFWTDETFRIHGYAPGEKTQEAQELIQASLRCFEPEDRPRIAKAFEDCLERAEPYDLEFPFVNAAGERTWIRTSAEPVMNGGHVAKVIGSIMDITPQKRAQEKLSMALADSQDKTLDIAMLLEATRSIPLASTFEESARKIYDICKARVRATCGYVALMSKDGSQNEVLFLDDGGLPCAVDPDLPMPVRGLRAVAYESRDVAFCNDFDDSQWAGFLPEGHIVLAKAMFSPLNFGDKTVGVIGLANKPGGFDRRDADIARSFGDIAALALKQALSQDIIVENERKYREIFESIQDVFFRTDRDFHLNIVSPSCEKIFGWSRQRMEGTSLVDCFIDKGLGATLAEKLRENGRVEGFEAMVPHADGRDVWVSINAHALRDGDACFCGAQGTVRDVTRRKKMEAQLHQARKMESIGNLAGGIAHDFNNILAGIIGYVELALEETPKGGKLAFRLREIFDAALRASSLVGQILSFSRQADVESKPVKVADVAEETAALLRAALPSSVMIEKNVRSDAFVLGDATQIHQIFMNMFTNSAQAMEKDGGGTLKLVVEETLLDARQAMKFETLKPGPHVRITVSDTGEGIPVNVIDSVFEPYFTTKGPGHGTGMGLAVVHGIVAGLGGEISVESEKGKGAVFTIYLPATECVGDSEVCDQEEIVGGNERILFVDDDLAIAEANTEALRKLGYDVSVRYRGMDALVLFRSDPDGFDLVVTDMTMPDIDGDRLAAELRKIRPDIPVVLCTGYHKEMSEEKAAQLGVKALLYKPVVKRTMARTVREVLDKARTVDWGSANPS